MLNNNPFLAIIIYSGSIWIQTVMYTFSGLSYSFIDQIKFSPFPFIFYSC